MADLLPTLPILLILAAIVFRRLRAFPTRDHGLLWMSFVGHVLAGFANILITQKYYEVGDMVTYHHFGVLAADRLRSDFVDFAPRLLNLILQRPEPLPLPINVMSGSSGSMQGISAFLMLLLNDSLYATCTLIAGAAFLSKLSLYVLAREQLPEVSGRALLCACMLEPSAVFWSSALLKEPIAMIGLLMSTAAAYEVIVRKRRARGAWLLLLGGPLMLIKGYLLPVLALAVGAWYLFYTLRENRGDVVVKLGHVLLAGAVVTLIILGTGAVLPRFALDSVEDELARLQVVGANLNAGTNYTLGGSSGEATQQIAMAPFGLLTALFRPMLFEVNSPLVLVNALEMTVFTIAVVALPFRRGIFAMLTEILQRPFLMFSVAFVVMFGTCAGLGSTNLGTLSRYRMPLMPFFAITLVALSRKRAAVDARSAHAILRTCDAFAEQPTPGEAST